MSQFEQENDLGHGGGEVDDETMDDARETADELAGREAGEEDDAS